MVARRGSSHSPASSASHSPALSARSDRTTWRRNWRGTVSRSSVEASVRLTAGRRSVSWSFAGSGAPAPRSLMARPTCIATPSMRRISAGWNLPSHAPPDEKERADRLTAHHGGRERHRVRIHSRERLGIDARIVLHVRRPERAAAAPGLAQQGKSLQDEGPRGEQREQVLGHVIAGRRHEALPSARRAGRRRPCRRRMRAPARRASRRITSPAGAGCEQHCAPRSGAWSSSPSRSCASV